MSTQEAKATGRRAVKRAKAAAKRWRVVRGERGELGGKVVDPVPVAASSTRKQKLYIERLGELTPAQSVEMVRSGVSVRKVGEFARSFGLPKEEMFTIIHLSRSTAHRMERKNQVMDPLRSDAFAGASRVIQKAREMLGSEEAVRRWLSTPIPALDSKPPLEWLDTSEGRQMVSGLLDQIRSGAYA